MSDAPFAVTDVRDRPDLAPVVADRVWRAWWRPRGHPLAPIAAFLQTTLGGEPVPSALVAHDGEAYLGSALLIASDVDSRPHYTPWIAAVWVEEGRSGRGVGSALVRAGVVLGVAAGIERIHICAMPHNHAFYRRLGWRLLEADVDGKGLAVFRSP